MSQSPSEPEFDDEDLVAYLDGELEPDQARRIESGVARDPQLRSRMNGLERTWGLLENLPLGEPTGNFARTTIELVVEDIHREQRRLVRTRLRRTVAAVLLAGLPVLLGGLAFFFVRYLQNIPEQELLRDLPVIQRVEAYDSISEIGFLEGLYRAGVFPAEGIHGGR